MTIEYIKALVDQLDKEIVICDMKHTILYMNEKAIDNYRGRFGDDLIGNNLLDCHNANSCKIIEEKLEYAIANNMNSIQITDNPQKEKKSYITILRDSEHNPIGYYERYEGNKF